MVSLLARVKICAECLSGIGLCPNEQSLMRTIPRSCSEVHFTKLRQSTRRFSALLDVAQLY